MELQENQTSQRNLEKEEKNWKTHTFQFQKLLQRYGNLVHKDIQLNEIKFRAQK